MSGLPLLDPTSSLFLLYLLFYWFCRNHYVVLCCPRYCFQIRIKGNLEGIGGGLCCRDSCPVSHQGLLSECSSTSLDAPSTWASRPGRRADSERGDLGVNKKERFVFWTRFLPEESQDFDGDILEASLTSYDLEVASLFSSVAESQRQKAEI